MNSALENYVIRICRKEELTALQKFINDHWRNNHLLATNKVLMDWQHLDRKNQSYNFIIAECRITKQIHGILGFIPTSHFDNSIKYFDIWLALWKVKDGINITGLGMVLLQFLINIKKPRSIAGYGFNKSMIPILRFFGHDVKELNHYYIINEKKNNFGLIGNFDGLCKHKNFVLDNEKKFMKYNESNFLELSKESSNFFLDRFIPTKSFTYYYNRYFLHPIYKYHIYGIVKKGKTLSILVFRLATHQSNRALRMVDYFGPNNSISGMTKEFQKLLYEYDAEYVDFYNLGFRENLLISSGFIKKGTSSKVIIPSYFEPFEKKNVTLRLSLKCDKKYNYFICKGDGDQDRPS